MTSFSRRQFLTITGAGVTLSLVAACAPAAPRPATPPASGSGTPTGSKQRIPAYIQIQEGPKPDLPPRADGVDAGYFTFPQTLFDAVKESPGKGEDVTLMTNLIQGAVVALDQNLAWQAVNKDMGLTVRQQVYGSGDYRNGLATTIAGGNLPDTIYNQSTNVIANLPQFLQTQCADLTPYIGGDAVKDYPNLANIPTPCWAETVYNGAVYGIPVPRAPFLNSLVVRQDIVDQMGLSAPKSADDFKRYLVALTDAQQNRFGLGASMGFGLGSQTPLLMIFGAPNNWKLDAGGKLVKDFETEEFKAAVGFARDLWAAGVYHPDSRTLTGTTLSTALRGDRAVVVSHSFGALIAQWPLLGNEKPSAMLRVIHPFSADGKAKPIYHQGPSNFGMSFVKKADPERVKLLLRVLNYIASPFGSQEFALLNYGIEGTHFEKDAQGIPVLNQKGQAEVLTTWKYITNNPQVLFASHRSREYATNIQADEIAMADAAITDPTLGLYSATYSSQKVILDQAMTDGVNDIVVGRTPLTDLDGLVSAWRTNGGDKARTEYQEALAARQ